MNIESMETLNNNDCSYSASTELTFDSHTIFPHLALDVRLLHSFSSLTSECVEDREGSEDSLGQHLQEDGQTCTGSSSTELSGSRHTEHLDWDLNKERDYTLKHVCAPLTELNLDNCLGKFGLFYNWVYWCVPKICDSPAKLRECGVDEYIPRNYERYQEENIPIQYLAKYGGKKESESEDFELDDHIYCISFTCLRTSAFVWIVFTTVVLFLSVNNYLDWN